MQHPGSKSEGALPILARIELNALSFWFSTWSSHPLSAVGHGTTPNIDYDTQR